MDKSFATTVMDICRFENKKIIEQWGVADRLSMIAQLGLLPQPLQGK
jgi:predicted ester cyclase